MKDCKHYWYPFYDRLTNSAFYKCLICGCVALTFVHPDKIKDADNIPRNTASR